MPQYDTDFSLSLEELTGLIEGDPQDAPTPMVAAIQRSWKKPLSELSDSEIGQLVVQHWAISRKADWLQWYCPRSVAPKLAA